MRKSNNRNVYMYAMTKTPAIRNSVHTLVCTNHKAMAKSISNMPPITEITLEMYVPKPKMHTLISDFLKATFMIYDKQQEKLYETYVKLLAEPKANNRIQIVSV